MVRPRGNLGGADGFEHGRTIRELAATLERSFTAINAELIRQELISPEQQGATGIPAAAR